MHNDDQPLSRGPSGVTLARLAALAGLFVTALCALILAVNRDHEHDYASGLLRMVATGGFGLMFHFPPKKK